MNIFRTFKTRFDFDHSFPKIQIDKRVFSSNNSGGVTLRIVVVSATFLLIVITVLALLKSYRNEKEISVRKVMAISEYGLLHAMQKLSDEPGWREGFDHVDYEQGWYSVSLKAENSRDTVFLKVISKGHIGSTVDERSVKLRGIISNNDTTWSRF
jgi:hypothetical protein